MIEPSPEDYCQVRVRFPMKDERFYTLSFGDWVESTLLFKNKMAAVTAAKKINKALEVAREDYDEYQKQQMERIKEEYGRG